jgi:hypothetical protein
MRQGSLRLKEQLPDERILKLETFTFTNETLYFSNAMISAFDDWVNGFNKIKIKRYYLLGAVNPLTPQGKYP